MDFRIFTTRQALATLGACFGLLLLASPAGAVPAESDALSRYLANHEAHEERVHQATSGGQSDSFQRYLANARADEQAYTATRAGIPDSVVALIEKNSQADEPAVIPYLSHGEGVLVGKDGRPESQPEVIPYLSHGIGVADGGSAVHLREQPDGFQPQLHGVKAAPVAADGFDWETPGLVTGGIIAGVLLALMSTIVLRDRRGLRSA